MPDTPHRSVWQRLRRLMLVAVIVFIALNISCIVYLQTRPVPSQSDLNAGESDYRRVRAMFPDPTRHDPVTSNSLAESRQETPQARCDRLVRELLVAEKYWKPGEVRRGNFDKQNVFAVFDQVNALVALYDQGVRVSPELSDKYSAVDLRILMNISSILKPGLKPGDDERAIDLKFARLFNAPTENLSNTLVTLKFLRVTDAITPWEDTGFYPFLRDALSTSSVTALPKLLDPLDANLLAPRGPFDCDRLIKLTLDSERFEITEQGKLLHFGTAYQTVKRSLQYENRVKNPILSNALAVTFAVTIPPTMGASAIKREIQKEKAIQEYAAGLAQHDLHPEKIPNETFDAIEERCEQIQSRRLAAVLDVRRGAAIPAPDKIGPDSYFYDPLTQRPYQMYQLPGAKNTVQVVMCRTVAPYTQSHENNKPLNLKQTNVMTFTLPANHPGLDAIPKAPQEIQLSLIYK